MKRLDLNQEPTFGRANTFLSHGLYLDFFFLSFESWKCKCGQESVNCIYKMKPFLTQCFCLDLSCELVYVVVVVYTSSIYVFYVSFFAPLAPEELRCEAWIPGLLMSMFQHIIWILRSGKKNQSTLCELETHPVLHIQTENCCTQCKELDQVRCKSWGRRPFYPRSDHEEHGAYGYGTKFNCWGNTLKCFHSHLLMPLISVAVPEGSPLHVLSTESHVDSFFEQRAKSHVLPESPVTNSLSDHVGTAVQDSA